MRSILVASSLVVGAAGCGDEPTPVVAEAPKASGVDERGPDDDLEAGATEDDATGEELAPHEPPAAAPTSTQPPPTAPSPPADEPPEEPAPVPAALTLYVSNQSYEDPTVHLTVWLDDVVVIDAPFEVGDQHNWQAFELELRPGTHRLRAVADTGAELEAVVETGTEPRWADLSYWWHPDDPPRRFSFGTHDEPPAFG